jgi:hypothetical protein
MKVRYLLTGVVVMFVVGLLLAVSSEAKIDPKIIAAMWLLDEGKGDKAKDSLGVGNNGTLKNNPKWIDGKFGKALEFDGVNQYVDCGIDASLDLTGDFTIVAWINFEDPKHAYDYSQIVSRTDGGGNITFPSSNQPTGIGRSPARDLLPYKGIIDDVAVFTQALTKTDVKNIMNQGLERSLGLSAVLPVGKLAATWANIKTR